VAANAVPALSTSAEAPDSINPPCFLVLPDSPVAKFDVCMGAGITDSTGRPMTPTEFNLRGYLIIARSDIVTNVQDNLDQWLGYEQTASTVSVAMAIDLDPTLGGLVEWCIPTIENGYGPVEWSGVTYFGAKLILNVSAR
jgi:hypothetical protein